MSDYNIKNKIFQYIDSEGYSTYIFNTDNPTRIVVSIYKSGVACLISSVDIDAVIEKITEKMSLKLGGPHSERMYTADEIIDITGEMIKELAE